MSATINNPVLEQLRDIHTPDAVSAWPPAIGWYFVAVLALVLMGLLVWTIITFIKARKHDYRRHALKQLQMYQKNYEQSSKDGSTSAQATMRYTRQLNELVKQVAITAYERTTVSALTGKKWQSFLESSLISSGDSSLSNDKDKSKLAGTLAELQGYLYQAENPSDKQLSQFSGAVRDWIKRHKTYHKKPDALDFESSSEKKQIDVRR